MKTLCIIQARMGSTRLPGKILLPVKGKPLIAWELERLRCSKKINKIILATSTAKDDDKTEAYCKENDIECFRGSEDDVLERYFKAASKYPEYDNIVRVTGDCPLIDPKVIDQLIELHERGQFDYSSNVQKETYPDGMDAEIFTRQALYEAFEKASLRSEREHVTLYIRNNPKFRKGSLESEENFSKYRLTVDNPEDFEVIKYILESTSQSSSFLDYVKFIVAHPDVFKKNAHIKRNEGLAKSLREDTKI